MMNGKEPSNPITMMQAFPAGLRVGFAMSGEEPVYVCYFVSEYTITLWFPCLDGLIQTRGNVARVKKGARNTSRRRVILRASFS